MSTAETPTGTLDPIPDLVKVTLNKLEIRPEQIRFAVQSDVNAAGTYGEEWFVLTDAAIFTVTGKGEVLHYIPYKNVLGIRAEAVVDAGLLVLETETGTVDLIRYSNSCASKFGFVARFIGDEIEFRKGKRDEAPIWDYKPEEQFCQSCGLLLPDEFSPCPACTKKTQSHAPDFVLYPPLSGSGNPVHAICDCWHRHFARAAVLLSYPD